MKQAPTSLSAANVYLWVMGLFWVLGGVALLIWGYKDSFLILNGLHSPMLDQLFPHLTHLGEGAMLPALFGLLLLRKNLPLVMTMLLTMLGVTLVISIAKNYVFADWYRPLAIFGADNTPIHYIALRRWTLHAFPSGHSAAATASMLIYASYFGRMKLTWSWAIGLLAVTVCYSRLYIGVHFLGDVIMGSIIGGTIAWLCLAFLYPIFQNKMSESSPQSLRVWQYLLGGAAIIAFLISTYFLLDTYYFYERT